MTPMTAIKGNIQPWKSIERPCKTIKKRPHKIIKVLQDHKRPYKATIGRLRPCQVRQGQIWPRKHKAMILSHFELTTFSSILSNFHCEHFLFDQERILFANISSSLWNIFCSRTFFVPFVPFFYSCFHANNNKASYRTFEQSSRSKILTIN